MHRARLPTELASSLVRGTEAPCPLLSLDTRDSVGLQDSWVDFTLWEGGAELGGRWDNCREGDGGNSVAWQRKAMARGGLQAGKTSSGLVGAGQELGPGPAGWRPGQARVGRQSWLPVLALPFVSSVTPGRDFTSLSHSFHH